MKEIRSKEDKAVSPIIATILLIAITVVLAATLVTILGGFTHGVSNTVETAGVTSNVVPTTNGYELFINVSSSSSSISSSAVTISVTGGNIGSSSGPTSESLSTAATSTSPSTFTGGSDYVVDVYSTSSSSAISFELIYKGNVIYNSAA
jgi:flagellin-like protein